MKKCNTCKAELTGRYEIDSEHNCTEHLIEQLAEARENIYKYAEIALMEGKDEFGHSWEDFKQFVLDEQLKEQNDE